MKRMLCIRLPKTNCKLQIEKCKLQFLECCGRFSPIVGLEPTDGDSLLLDITGLAHLFGGEAALAAEILRDFARLGLNVRVGIADTIGAAWAAAHYREMQIENCKLTIANCRTQPNEPMQPIDNLQFTILRKNKYGTEFTIKRCL